jgi:hypothetical protein
MAEVDRRGTGWAGLSAMPVTALRRLWHDRVVVGATGLLVVVGLVQLAAAPIYTEAVTVGALRWAVGAAPADDTIVRVEATAAPGGIPAADRTVLDTVAVALPDVDTQRSRRLVTGSFGLPGPDGGDRRAVTVLASVTGIEERASLVDGRWPDGPGDRTRPVAAALVEGVAERLGLASGDRVELMRLPGGDTVEVEVVGLYRLDDPTDRFWSDDPLLANGVVDGRSFRTLGPFVVSEPALLQDGFGRLRATWRFDPDLSRLTTAGADDLERRLAALPERIDTALAGLPEEVTAQLGGVETSTGLPGLLADSARSVTLTRSGILAVAAQLTVLAGLALAMGAGLVAEARRHRNAMLGARGAGRAHLVGLAAIEGLVLVVPAVLAAPWLAVLTLRAMGRWGPLASVGFPIEPTIPGAFSLPVMAAGGAMVALLVVPALRGGAAAAVTGRHRRQDRRPVVARVGLDAALAIVTAAAFWQLGRLGTGARSVLGDRFSVDPLLVVTPALALLTGALVTLRFVPLLANLAERSVARGRSVVGTLAGWQIARRPTDQARSVFLLALALAIGGFAAAYATTWRVSQDDQATQRLGADVVVLPDRRVGQSMADLNLVATYGAVDGVAAVLAVARSGGSLPAADRPVAFLALDATVAPEVVLTGGRDPDAFVRAMGILAEARPRLAGVALPAGASSLELAVVAVDRTGPTIGGGGDETSDGDGGGDETGDGDGGDGDGGDGGDPVGFDGWVDAMIQDGDGLLHRLELGRVTAGAGPTVLGLDLLDRARVGGPLRTTDPLTLVGIEVRLPVPAPPSRSTDVELGPLRVMTSDGPATEVPLTSRGGATAWSGRAVITTGLLEPPEVAVVGRAGGAIDDGFLRLEVTTGSATTSALVVFDLRPGPAVLPPDLPILVDRAWLEASGTTIGDRLEVPALGLADRQAVVAGVVDGFPSVDPTTEAVVVSDLATLQALAHRPGRPIESVEELWLATSARSPGEGPGGSGPDHRLMADLRAPPLDSDAVDDRAGLAASLQADPVALAAIGAYVIGAGAASVFAFVVFVASAAMSARQRRHEFVLLRALGLTPRQFAAWMAVEQFALLAVSVILGTVLGLGLALAVLPRLAIDQAGGAVVPPPRTVIPWGTVAVVELVPVAALVIGVVAGAAGLRRRGIGTELRGGDD